MKTGSILAALFVAMFMLSSVAYSGDLYGVLRNPNNENKAPGICSAEIDFAKDKVWVSATANNLRNKRAYSTWITTTVDGVSSTSHLDGAIGSKGKSYKFQGHVEVDTDLLETIVVQLREHPKVKGGTSDETIIEWITTPNGGCDGTCPTVGRCEMVLF